MVQFGEKLPPLASLELLAAEYLREINISVFIYYLLRVTCFLDALKMSSKWKEMRIKKEKVEVLPQTIYSRKETGKQKTGIMEFLALNSVSCELFEQ